MTYHEDYREQKLQELCDEIDADVNQVIELFVDNATSYRMRGEGFGLPELIGIAVKAMNAWPAIEKLAAGIKPERSEEAALPELFQEMKSYMQLRTVLVRQKADELLPEHEHAERRAWASYDYDNRR